MSILRGSKVFARLIVWVPLWALLFGAIDGPGGGAYGASTASPSFSRPDAATIRSASREVLSSPRFAPRRTLWQWLTDKLSNWEGPDLHLPQGLADLLVWLLIIWCVLTLLAIFGHFLWTVGLFFGGKSRGLGLGRGASSAAGYHTRTSEELLALMREYADRGAFREALGLMATALLQALQSGGLLKFHESKTNGEYLREFPKDRPARNDFRRFVLMTESVVYGGAPCGAETYRDVYSLFERIRESVHRPA